jgi:mRNA interferase YafQ
VTLTIGYTKQFKKDLKKAKTQGKNLKLLKDIIEQITLQKPLQKHLRDHSLNHNWSGHRELHIQNDWLLIYKLISEEKLVVFVRTGSHSELFNM